MLKQVLVPDIGSYSNVNVIEVLVSEGDTLRVDTPLITLETDKATLEVPAPFVGVVKSVKVKVGDKVSEGSLIFEVEATDAPSLSSPTTAPAQSPAQMPGVSKERAPREGAPSHATPTIRRFARELGVELDQVAGNGPRGRILREDVQEAVRNELSKPKSLVGDLPPWPDLDFSEFGKTHREPLSRIKKLSGAYLHRNWVMIPHVTHFEEADITDLEILRKEQQPKAIEAGAKLTPLVYIMKALLRALQAHPNFNASLDQSTQELIIKDFYHFGVAVDTPEGLVVPVVRDVDQKDLLTLAKELGQISEKARLGQLKGKDLQGNSFTLSSLGGIGGTAFTPIVNAPDVAILGVSKAQLKPVWDGSTWISRLYLPLSLSYDHRVIDGAQAARFMVQLAKELTTVREWI